MSWFYYKFNTQKCQYFFLATLRKFSVPQKYHHALLSFIFKAKSIPQTTNEKVDRYIDIFIHLALEIGLYVNGGEIKKLEG